MKISKAKHNESEVCKRFNKIGVFQLMQDEFAPYDIEGFINSKKYLVEVKFRTKLWFDWVIETRKIDLLVKLAKEQKAVPILVMSVGNKHLVYDPYEIQKQPIINKTMNHQTAEEFKESGVKKLKKVYNFPFFLYFRTL